MKKLLIVLLIGLLSGCLVTVDDKPRTVNLSRTTSEMPFIAQNATTSERFSSLYSSTETSKPRISVVINQPLGYKIKFDKSFEVFPISDKITYKMKEGVYPFELSRDGKNVEMTGALVVFNVDETTTLATFGLSDETRLFTPEMIEKALNGTLVSHTISYDDKNVIHYWLGNRSDLYDGGNYDVEMDFTKTPRIKKFEIKTSEGKKKGTRPLLKVGAGNNDICLLCGSNNTYDGGCMSDINNGGHLGVKEWKNVNYAFEMELDDGSKYQGFIRNLKGSAYTAFCSVPCQIDDEMFEVAQKGTIAKLEVTSAGEDSETIAEILFGIAR